MAQRDFTYLLNQSLLACLRRNRPFEALEIFREQISSEFSYSINESSVAVALKACRWYPNLTRQLHCFTISSGFASSLAVSNSLMNVYCKSAQFHQALRIFNKLSSPNTVSWNTILNGFDNGEDALAFVRRMHLQGLAFNMMSFPIALSFCSMHEHFFFGFQLHCLIAKKGFSSEVFAGNALVTMYSKWGQLQDTVKVFDELPHKDLVTWNSLLAAYTQVGQASETILTFLGMLTNRMDLDHISFSCAISASGHVGNLILGKQIHCLALRAASTDSLKVCNLLISMYDRCGSPSDAKTVFEGMNVRDIVSWTSMMSVEEDNAVTFFTKMIRIDGVYPTAVTFVELLHAISNKELVDEGEMVHGFCFKSGFVSEPNVGNSLISMYARIGGSMNQSIKIFDELDSKDTNSWNSLISGFAHNEMYHETLETFFSAIQYPEFKPNHYTFGSVVSAIGASNSIPTCHGQKCHSQITKLGLGFDKFVSATLLDMYAKRGIIIDSQKIYNEREPDQVGFSTMISAYAQYGDYKSAIALFETIPIHIHPDPITFLVVLTACSRSGTIELGQKVFKSMKEDHKIEPSIEHYSSMVDMLARAGRLKEAKEFLNEIPKGMPRVYALHSLVAFGKIYGDLVIGKEVGDAIMEMAPMDSESYVVMANLHAEKGEWEDAVRIRRRMNKRGLSKEGGLSWVDVGSDDGLFMCGFGSNDDSHLQSKEIFEVARCLGMEMKYLKQL